MVDHRHPDPDRALLRRRAATTDSIGRRLRAKVRGRARPTGAGTHRRPLRRAARRGDPRGALVRADDRERRTFARDPRPVPRSRPGHQAALLRARRGKPAPRDPPAGGRAARRRPRVHLGLPARRGRLRLGGHPRALPQAVARLGAFMRRTTFSAQAAAAARAGDRRHRRAPGSRPSTAARAAAGGVRRSRSRASAPCLAARARLREGARPRATRRALFFSFEEGDAAELRGAAGSGLGLDMPLEVDRRAVPRPRRAASSHYLRADHRRPGDGRHRRHAGAGRARHRPSPAQPARALPQAAAPVRAAGDPRRAFRTSCCSAGSTSR